MAELGFDQTIPTTLMIDNQTAIKHAKGAIATTAIKHIAIDVRFMEELVKEKKITPTYCPTASMFADTLTKPVKNITHKMCVSGMGLIQLPQ